MEKNNILGRARECERLNECMDAETAQLIIVYGRRRVGKTFLINEYFGNDFAFKLTGTFEGNRNHQLRNFASALRRKTHKKALVPGDWLQAFEELRDYLETLPTDTKQVVFFDEMPWLDTQKSGFLPAFEWFWNDWASTQNHFVFIVCGSATSWMDEKIANNRGGLFNRQTCKLYLQPFNLAEVKAFLEHKKIRWSYYDITLCYMIMGGIPYYLSLLRNRLSLSQNIDKLFFAEGGELHDEFDHLYRTLFNNSASYQKVAEALSAKKGGLTRNEIIEKTGLPTNGDLSKILKDLTLSGFVRVSDFYKRKKKDKLYQLVDYYSLFYFRYIQDNHGRDENFWSNTTDNPARRAWEGLTFEQVCKGHIGQIKQKLGISGILTEEYSWFVPANKDEGISGAQIDLLLARRDGVVTICEIKFSHGEYEIDKEYDMNLRKKVAAFVKSTNARESIHLVMITTYGVKRNMYSSLIQNQVTLEDLFREMA